MVVEVFTARSLQRGLACSMLLVHVHTYYLPCGNDARSPLRVAGVDLC